MKEVVNSNNETVLVDITTPVKTIDGIHYLLSIEELEDIQVRADLYLEEEPTRLDNEITIKRKQVYEQESDPLFFKYSREEVTKQEWLDKIQEIKIRYPRG